MPPIEISPTSSQRDSPISLWWTAAKSRLAPAKDSRKGAKAFYRLARRTREQKFNDPTLLSLVTPLKLSPKGALLSAPPSPMPGAQSLPSSLLPSLAPSLLRPPGSLNAPPSRTPSREPPPLCTRFTNQGTLVVIARYFENTKKWTVGHVRALEGHMGHMGDVERWLSRGDTEGDIN